jgi:hypothetical protein
LDTEARLMILASSKLYRSPIEVRCRFASYPRLYAGRSGVHKPLRRLDVGKLYLRTVGIARAYSHDIGCRYVALHAEDQRTKKGQIASDINSRFSAKQDSLPSTIDRELAFDQHWFLGVLSLSSTGLLRFPLQWAL